MTKDALGDRMKQIEQTQVGHQVPKGLPVCLRLDGRSFSNFTRDMKRPFDQGMTYLMQEVTAYLVEETDALIAYMQSDEISLILHTDNPNSEILFNGKIQKLVSVLAAMATAKFNQRLHYYFPIKVCALPVFDCRVWGAPSKMEAVNVLVWRELDAIRNSVSGLAQAHFSHKELHLKNNKDKLEMLAAIGIKWDDLSVTHQRGSYFRRKLITRLLTPMELAAIPEKHRPDPQALVRRRVVAAVELPQLTTIENKVEVIFDGAEPVLKSVSVSEHETNRTENETLSDVV